jgi:hypothetical protein
MVHGQAFIAQSAVYALGVSATRPRNTHGQAHHHQIIGVTELAWWPNSWGQTKHRHRFTLVLG